MTIKTFTAAASVCGREHLRLGRNNQDGVALRRAGELTVAVVTDGCSAGRASEIGARLGAAWLGEWLPFYAARHADAADLAAAATAGLVSYLGTVARASAPRPPERWSFIADHLLFTYLAAVVSPARTVVFGVGDGVVGADDAALTLDPGPDNAPDYAAYRLLPASVFTGAGGARRVEARVHLSLPTAGIDRLLIGTDGAAPLVAPGVLEAVTFENPHALQRRLNVLSRRPGLLTDDTTVALIARRAAAVRGAA